MKSWQLTVGTIGIALYVYCSVCINFIANGHNSISYVLAGYLYGFYCAFAGCLFEDLVSGKLALSFKFRVSEGFVFIFPVITLIGIGIALTFISAAYGMDMTAFYSATIAGFIFKFGVYPLLSESTKRLA